MALFVKTKLLSIDVGCRGPKLSDLQEYLKQVPTTEVDPMPHGSQLLDDDVVKEIERMVDSLQVSVAHALDKFLFLLSLFMFH